jgi:hypothetical protein
MSESQIIPFRPILQMTDMTPAEPSSTNFARFRRAGLARNNLCQCRPEPPESGPSSSPSLTSIRHASGPESPNRPGRLVCWNRHDPPVPRRGRSAAGRAARVPPQAAGEQTAAAEAQTWIEIKTK